MSAYFQLFRNPLPYVNSQPNMNSDLTAVGNKQEPSPILTTFPQRRPQ